MSVIKIDAAKKSAISAAREIAALEASVTSRNLRCAALGDQFAIDHIQSVEDQIQELRK